jgi:hypothetical protein
MARLASGAVPSAAERRRNCEAADTSGRRSIQRFQIEAVGSNALWRLIADAQLPRLKPTQQSANGRTESRKPGPTRPTLNGLA